MSYEFVTVEGTGSLSSVKVEFIKPFEPYPLPVMEWADRVVSEHQMRPGIEGGHLVGGDLVRQDFGSPSKAGYIPMTVPFLTKAMRDKLDQLRRGQGNVKITIPWEGERYVCIFSRAQMPRRTSRFGQYSGEFMFLVEEIEDL